MPRNCIQVVFVKWGTKKYSAAYVNALVQTILDQTAAEVRFVCLTEHSEGIDPRVTVRPFPDLGLPLETLTSRGGSLPKMGIFADGVLQKGLPTLYIDLDSSVFGDIQRVADCLTRKRDFYILQRHAIPYWRCSKLVRRLLPERYYLGNTAIMAFYPEDWGFMYDRVRREYPAIHTAHATHGTAMPKDYRGGNEYLISRFAGHDLRVFPMDTAVKFTQEYMAPLDWMTRIRNHLPWVKARRKRQAIVTYHGAELKPEKIIWFEPGDKIRFKHHVTDWQYPEITAYWRRFLVKSA